jgi:hypothetical protein
MGFMMTKNPKSSKLLILRSEYFDFGLPAKNVVTCEPYQPRAS